MKIMNLGQYFTKSPYLQEVVFNLIYNKPRHILEPSCGRGDLVVYISKRIPTKFHMFEIDHSIKFLQDFKKEDGFKLIIEDFLEADIDKKYTTIIGNPPYIRTKSGNKYLDFIEKCVSLLKDRGELIFITPSDLFKLTSAFGLLQKMMQEGTFTHIIHPHNENLFEGAKIDILIFRYCKDPNLPKIVEYNGIEKSIYYDKIISFSSQDSSKFVSISDYFNVYVGCVSACEQVFKSDIGNKDVLTGEDKVEKYIFIDNTTPTTILDHLKANKDILMNRKIRKFNENNWFEWGAPRNIKVINNNLGKKCIYMYSITRKDKIAFISEVMMFNGNLLLLLSKIELSEKILKKIIKYFNSTEFKENFMQSGRFKISQNQLINSKIPHFL